LRVCIVSSFSMAFPLVMVAVMPFTAAWPLVIEPFSAGWPTAERFLFVQSWTASRAFFMGGCDRLPLSFTVLDEKSKKPLYSFPVDGSCGCIFALLLTKKKGSCSLWSPSDCKINLSHCLLTSVLFSIVALDCGLSKDPPYLCSKNS
jgi:squalene cyclase